MRGCSAPIVRWVTSSADTGTDPSPSWHKDFRLIQKLKIGPNEYSMPPGILHVVLVTEEDLPMICVCAIVCLCEYVCTCLGVVVTFHLSRNSHFGSLS